LKLIIIFIIITCSYSSLYSSENRIILSGFTYHIDRTNDHGIKYNELNYGFGVEHNTREKNENLYMNYKIMIIADSYEKPFPFISVGGEYKLNTLPLAFSLDVFSGIKHLGKKYALDENGDYYIKSGTYKPILGLAPSIKLFIKDVSVNLSYSPEVIVKNKYLKLHPPAFFYMTFGYKI